MKGYQGPIPQFPLYEARPGALYDVREFIQPGEVAHISSRLWRESGGDPNKFVSLALDWVHRNITYKYEPGEYWQTPAQTLMKGSGDCEDEALLFQSIVEPYINDRLVGQKFYVGLGEVDGQGHAFNLLLSTCPDEEPMVFDAVAGGCWPMGARKYKLWYYFDSKEAHEVRRRRRPLYLLRRY
ncbi:MAG: hypothetical protein DRI26_02830 [Chloroflexi bacterium]|nr:MAG: hypothetical protein DRI26_02830 [Chloroflexota bacterium]